MPRKINTPEQIINKLREAEIRLSQVVLRSRESNISSKCYPTIYFLVYGITNIDGSSYNRVDDDQGIKSK